MTDGLFRRGGQGLVLALWVAAVLLVWEAGAWFIAEEMKTTAPASKLPYLHKVFGTLAEHLPTLLKQGTVTFGNSITGFVIGSAVGAGLAILMSVSRAAEHTLSPYMIASQMIPIIGLAPIIYGIVRDAELSRVLMAGYVTFFPVAIHMLRGLRSVSPDQVELMRTYAASTWMLYGKLKLRAALPGLFAGLKLSAPLAITASIIVELMGAPDGIGVLMVSSLYYGTSQVYMFWSTVLISMMIGIVLYLLIAAAERLLTPWQPEFRAKGRDEA
ncbi:ABC transporter permease [Paenibacillus harenae]|uniref:ABC transporter permease n=1 Tax=Paenibacillus harenae TaxID=306543 RepID=UPI002790F54C|nr:ABC transporter permease [Paenibacillus harenae]MDQ0058910.1 NitT/TauT family transport system permease protein [Paenibacillus harenae]